MHGQTAKPLTHQPIFKTHTHMQISTHCPAVSSAAVGKWSKPSRWPCLYSCVPPRPAWACSLRGAMAEKLCCMALIVGRLWGLPEPRVQHAKYNYSPRPATATYAYLPSHQCREVLTGISSSPELQC